MSDGNLVVSHTSSGYREESASLFGQEDSWLCACRQGRANGGTVWLPERLEPYRLWSPCRRASQANQSENRMVCDCIALMDAPIVVEMR